MELDLPHDIRPPEDTSVAATQVFYFRWRRFTQMLESQGIQSHPEQAKPLDIKSVQPVLNGGLFPRNSGRGRDPQLRAGHN